MFNRLLKNAKKINIISYKIYWITKNVSKKSSNYIINNFFYIFNKLIQNLS